VTIWFLTADHNPVIKHAFLWQLWYIERR
jgi:hypothetical protein